MLTLEKLNELEPGAIIASGFAINTLRDIYMNPSKEGEILRWVAKRGRINDWAIYIDWSNMTINQVMNYGTKIQDVEHIKKLVPCDEKALKRYRH